MDNLFLDILPPRLTSSLGEVCRIPNRLVFQIRNQSYSDGVELMNRNQTIPADFKRINEVEIIDGLSMIYLTFPLGTGDTSFTSEEYFSQSSAYVQENFLIRKPFPDHLVIFPKKTVQIPPCGQVELVLDHIITFLRQGGITSCEIKFVNVNGHIFGRHHPLYGIRHPLGIQRFEVSEESRMSGFRDKVIFDVLATGADSCIMMPGDISLAPKSRYETLLYKKTPFTLAAGCGDEQVSQSLELKPNSAKISNFQVTCVKKGASFEATVNFTVENTRHVFLNRIGRIEVKAGVKETITLVQDEERVRYALSVENEDGLVTKICTSVLNQR